MSMQGVICGVKRHAVHDGDGLRTTVFFKGCPLRCLWCHNPESHSFQSEIGFFSSKCLSCGICAKTCPAQAIAMENGMPVTDRTRCTGCGACADACPAKARTLYGEKWEAKTLAEKLLEDRQFFQNSGGGVTLSGGECLAQPAFALALAKELIKQKISVNIDTCGAVSPAALRDIAPYTDTFLFDLKAIDPAVHKRLTGRDNKQILENLNVLFTMQSRIEIRYPLVPGYNSGECAAIGAYLQHTPITKIKVLGYHNLAGAKYAALERHNTLPPATVTAEDVDAAVAILASYGLPAVNGMRED